MIITVLHISETLTLGGCCRVMEHLAADADREHFNSLMCGMSGDADYLKHLESRGLRYLLLEKEGVSMLASLPKPWVAVLHRSGNAAPFWNRWIPLLKKSGAAAVVERNIFGLTDRRNAEWIDRICANSLNTLWHHWKRSGEPEISTYLTNHRVLYNALDFEPDPALVAAKRAEGRAALGISPQAFVLGVVTRPDARKVDSILVALAPYLKRAIPEFTLVTRRYPRALAARLSAILGDRYHNLDVAHGRNTMIETYALMDVFGNFPGIGESFGMALAEAMRCGVPAVALDMPGRSKGNSQRELIDNGITGFLPDSPAGVVQALEILARDPDSRLEMGAAARVRMLAPPFALSSVLGQFETLVHGLVAGDAAEKPADIQPSVAEMTEYLHHYPSPLTLVWRQDVSLNLEAAAKRLYWKVMRRIKA